MQRRKKEGSSREDVSSPPLRGSLSLLHVTRNKFDKAPSAGGCRSQQTPGTRKLPFLFLLSQKNFPSSLASCVSASFSHLAELLCSSLESGARRTIISSFSLITKKKYLRAWKSCIITFYMLRGVIEVFENTVETVKSVFYREQRKTQSKRVVIDTNANYYESY